MRRKRRRLILVTVGMLLLGGATGLVLLAFQESIVFFLTPSEVLAQPVSPEQRIRLGGLVEADSVRKDADGLTLHFRVTDTVQSVPVRFRGPVPDLFREGQGVVAEGYVGADGTFVATNVLAKHDENYMPPEVAEALKRSGQWQGASE